MIRSVLAALAGFLAWLVVAQLGDMLLRVALPGYAAAEPAFAFTLPMMISRLVLGAACSLAAGFVCSAVARGRRGAVYGLAAVLLAMFLFLHITQYWAKFPVWYHLLFLVTLAPLVLGGAVLQRRTRARALAVH